jgi:asparagine synthase (glutamine-hydrolysing)
MVNGMSSLSNQPMTFDGENYLLCNGEIYNHRALETKYGISCLTGSDCEIILRLFLKIGFRRTIEQLDGEFAIVLITPDYVFTARDPYGVRALYLGESDVSIGFASEMKALHGLFPAESIQSIQQFKPGHIMQWNKKLKRGEYYTPYATYPGEISVGKPDTERLKNLLIAAVEKRLMCERTTPAGLPSIGAYLSGGFDSSAIAAILQKKYPGRLETFSIGFRDAPDLIYARKVAAHIGSKHHEYVITEQEALPAIPAVIRAIESYDTTTVRASTMMYLLSEYIKKNTSVVVMFSGEGSDEASGSYRYFHNAPSQAEFQAESLRLLTDLCYFDNLRADKSSAAWGLELRVPFLDLDFLNYYMTIAPQYKTQGGLEKYLLRQTMVDYLPEDVLYRPKEAMSDGVSLHNRSWSSIIQETARGVTGIADGLTAEKTWYLQVFQEAYPCCTGQIPYYWVPKWCGDVQDPSARTLAIYNIN